MHRNREGMLSTSEEQERRSLRDFLVIQTVYLQGKILSRVVTPERSGLPLGLAMLCGTHYSSVCWGKA